MNVAMLLEMLAEGAGERVILGTRAEGIEAADALARSRRAASFLRSMEIENVGLVDLNSEVVPIALFGSALAGLPFAPVNYRLADDQLSAILKRLAPGLVIAGDDMVERVHGVGGVTVMSRSEFGKAVASPRGDAGNPDDLPFVDPDEIAVMLFTSGTTGEPKAAILRHRHLTSYILGSVEYLAANEDEAQLVSVPAYHIAGISSVLSSLYSGRRLVYLPTFDPPEWVQLVRSEAITQAMVVPTMLGRILAELENTGESLPSLHHVSYGGGRMPLEVIERAMRTMPQVNFVNAYGLTETSSTVSVLGPEDHREALASSDPVIRRRLTSVGQALPLVEIEIRDPGGEKLSTGETGEIWVRGDQVAGEYRGGSALTEDGWFPTRDAGWLDEGGFLFLEGRLDDVIVRGGENLSPGEIEATLLSHPAVAEAAVVGVPDQEWGEAVGAAVVLEPGGKASPEELQDWVRQRLRSTKTPQVIQFRDEMPYTETGKLLRRVIRADLSAR
jgi:acyl-CoA synthetase (AMP-forming)/AMP-acid ligase II